MNTQDLIAGALAVQRALLAQEADIESLDRAIGDGDHFINVSRGCEVVTGMAAEVAPLPPAQAFHKVGMKLLSTELTQKFSEAGIDLLGLDGSLWEDDAPDVGKWAYQFLYDRSMTIAGGTSEVQRNIVAQRVLGLPRN